MIFDTDLDVDFRWRKYHELNMCDYFFQTVIFASLATLTVLSAENDSRAAVQVILHPGKHKLYIFHG